MKIIELHFSDTVKDFHTWCRNHNINSILIIQSLKDLTNSLEVYEKNNNTNISKKFFDAVKVYDNSELLFISKDCSQLLSVKTVCMPNNTEMHVVSHYFNTNNNVIYLAPSLWYEINEIFLLK